MEGSYEDLVSGASWLRCSWRVHAPRSLIRLGLMLDNLFSSIATCLGMEAVLVVLFFADIANKAAIEDQICKIHHLVLLPMVTLVGLYALFKERRPTVKITGGRRVHFGTYYGMPSGHSILGATVGGMLIANGYVIMGLLIALSVSFSRVISGFHSILQCIIGLAIGFVHYMAWHFLSEVIFVRVSWVLALLLPLLVLQDPALAKVEPGDSENLHVWIVVDLGYVIFDMIYCAPQCQSRTGARLLCACLCAMTTHITSMYMAEKGMSLPEAWKCLKSRVI